MCLNEYETSLGHYTNSLKLNNSDIKMADIQLYIGNIYWLKARYKSKDEEMVLLKKSKDHTEIAKNYALRLSDKYRLIRINTNLAT